MTLRLVFRPQARVEIRAAEEWYEDRLPGLGLEFVRAVDAALTAIQRFPAAYPVVHGATRQAVLRRFPYSVLFVSEPETIVILACFHQRREPRIWRSRSRDA